MSKINLQADEWLQTKALIASTFSSVYMSETETRQLSYNEHDNILYLLSLLNDFMDERMKTIKF